MSKQDKPQPTWEEEQLLAFEDWANERGLCLDTRFFDEGNNYIDPSTRLVFDAWTASAAALTAAQAGKDGAE